LSEEERSPGALEQGVALGLALLLAETAFTLTFLGYTGLGAGWTYLRAARRIAGDGFRMGSIFGVAFALLVRRADRGPAWRRALEALVVGVAASFLQELASDLVLGDLSGFSDATLDYWPFYVATLGGALALGLATALRARFVGGLAFALVYFACGHGVEVFLRRHYGVNLPVALHYWEGGACIVAIVVFTLALAALRWVVPRAFSALGVHLSGDTPP